MQPTFSEFYPPRSEVMKQNRMLVLVAALIMAAFFAVWSSSQITVHAQERQPHMEAALQHLKEAQQELTAATENKGGHRGTAIKLVDRAIAEVDAGIHYADKH
jgi:hypothetical protein